jgi:hypothetical protein
VQVSLHEEYGEIMATALDNKGTERAPTARLGLAIPENATVEWKI